MATKTRNFAPYGIFSAALLLFVLTGCERQGPAEQAGERLDRGVERAGEAVEDAGDRMRDQTQR